MTAMPNDDFADPGTPGGGFDYNDYLGALLLFDVVGIEDHVPNVNTKPGEKSPAVRADVYVLDGPHTGDANVDSLVFPKILQSQLRRMVGRRVLGRLGQGVAQPGKNAPWQLSEATAADKARAREWAAGRTTPAAATAGPTSASPPPF